MELTELEAAGLNASLYGPPADRVWLYVHGKGGCKEEAEDFAALACPRGWQVLGAGVSEAQLEAAGELDTPFGETLSWPYLQYVRAHPVSRWPTPTALLYASGDAMLRRAAVEDFARRFGGALTVLEGGEHWFHTP